MSDSTKVLHAEGIRQQWEDIPETTRTQVETWLASPVIRSESHRTGFSPGIASTLYLENGRKLFLKAAGSDINPRTPELHRREAHVMQTLGLSNLAPRLLWFLDDTQNGWVVLIFDYINGWHPADPWLSNELDRVIKTIIEISTSSETKSISTDARLNASTRFANSVNGWNKLRDSDAASSLLPDSWVQQHLSELCAMEQEAPEAVAGQSLVHYDLRADNILLTDNRVWILDWAGACAGADWLDMVLFAPSVGLQGGPQPETLIQYHPACQRAKPEHITAAVASLAGFYTYRALTPAPPGLPDLPKFFDARGIVTRDWLRKRMKRMS